ncbi:Dedicator of cytokinesis protein [Entamoeba marina]
MSKDKKPTIFSSFLPTGRGKPLSSSESAHSTPTRKNEHRQLYSEQRNNIPTVDMNFVDSSLGPPSDFYHYDIDGFGELNIYQVRDYLQNKKLFLTDEEIQKIMASVLMQTDKVTSFDFKKFNEYIEKEHSALKLKSNLYNSPYYRHELALIQNKHDDSLSQSVLMDVSRMDTPQDVLINCSSFPTDDIEIVHNEKPRMSLTTLENAIGTNFNELPNVQKNILSMIFSKTTEVSKLKPCFEKVELIEHPDPLQDSGEDLTTEDYPDIKILREDSSKQLPPNKIYENMFSLYDPTCNFGCERELLCGKTELELTNPTERESDMWVFEIGRCNVKDYPEEPLIGVISLYADQTKLTENFYVDLNPGHTKSYADEIPLEDHNKFCVIFKRKDLFKQESIKIKAIMLVYKNSRIGSYKLQFKRKRLYKQFLCVGSYDVSEAFKDEKSFGPKTLSMYREDIEKKSDLENFLTIDPTTRSLKQVIISCSLKAKITTRTTTGVQKMIQNPQKDYFIKDHNGFEVQQSCSTGTPIQLLENFTHITMFKHFFMDFTNNIYISPRELNIASISCSDRDLHDPSTIIPSFYSRITYEQDFVTSVSTTVSIGSKVDSYVDEIKAKLPVNLTDQHHLFFLIEDVAFDEEKRLEDPKKYYAYRPLFEQGKLIESGEFELPVYSIREATGYMTSTTKTIDSVGEKKSFLKVGIDIHSSLFAQDKKLYFLLDRICNKSSIKDIEKAMEPIDKIKVVPLMHFFPVIMRSFFNMYNVDIPQPQTSNVTVAVKPIDIKPSRLSIGNRVIEKNSPEKIMRTEPENKNFRSSVQLDTSRPSSGSFSSKKSDIVEHKDKPTDDHVFIFILKFFRSLLKDEDRVAKDFDKPRCRHPIFDDPVDIPIFQKLTTSLSTFFENGVKQKSQKINDQQTQLVDIALEYGWVFFNIIIKSLTLDLGKRKIFSSQHRLDEIHSLFNYQNTQHLTNHCLIRIRLANGMTKGLFYVNADFTLFMSELLRIYSHTISFEVMVTYLNSISRYYDKTTQTLFLPKGQSKPSNLNTSTTPIDTSEQARCWNAVELLRVDILCILSSFEYFYQVNIPALIKPNSFQSIGKLRSILNERHYLSTLIELSELRLLSRVDSINTFTLSVLLKRIIMFDIDKKFQNQKESIAQMFFPLVMYFIDNEKQLKETWFDPSMEAEKQDFYVCFLWVLKNINRDILKQYIKKEVVSKIHTFVDIIETAMDILKSAECYLEERRKRITDICSIKSKVSGKPPQGQNQFVPSPGLGSTLAIEKSLLKLQSKIGIENDNKTLK